MGGTGVFSYNEATADTSHSDLGSVISGLESSLADLGGFVNSVRSNWDGDEMDEYTGIQNQWDKASDTVTAILQSVRVALGSTTSSVKDMRSQVRGALAKH